MSPNKIDGIDALINAIAPAVGLAAEAGEDLAEYLANMRMLA